MLVFSRPAFKSGVMIVEDRDPEGKLVKHILRPTDQDKEAAMIMDEEYVGQRYPQWFMDAEKHAKRRKDDKKRRNEKKSRIF